MKILQVIAVFFISLIFQKCTSIAYISGRYSNVYVDIAGQEFKFTQAPNKFEYYSRTEGMVREFSSGTWIQNRRTILLNGFDDKDISVLNVENKVEEYPNENRDKFVVKYVDDPLDTFTKVDVIINGYYKIRVSGDTTFFSDMTNTTLQVKSYLSHEGVLLGTNPRVDTLYSPEIEIGSSNGKHKVVFLKFDLSQNSFYRTRLTDTLAVKNNSTLLWHKKVFKKIREYSHNLPMRTLC